MRKNIYIPVVSLFYLLSMLSLSSCIKEELTGFGEIADYHSVTINVLIPNQIVSAPMTRAGALDFDLMGDLNVVIATDTTAQSSILHTLYFKFAEVANGQPVNDTKVYYTDEKTEGGIMRKFSLQFTKEWLNEQNIPATACRFYLVGNWGEEITVTTVGELKRLKATSIKINDEGGVIVAPNVMFGEVTKESVGKHTHPGTGVEDNCRLLEMELERTAAMITVMMHGEGLASNIVISPTKIALHNVPVECTIGSDNIVTTDFGGVTAIRGAVSPDGESKYGDSFAGGVKLVGAGSDLLDSTQFMTSIGKHYIEDEEDEEYEPTFDDPSVMPLFLYENIHGKDFGARETDQRYKRPRLAKGTSEAEIDAVAESCSYLEVTADYFEYTDQTGTSLKQTGSISWRFFLGENVTDDFDVKRNTYYKIDLMLSGSSIAELNSSWRVTGKLSDHAIIGEDDIIVGGGGEIFNVRLLSAGNQNVSILRSEGADFIFIEEAKGGSTEDWIALNEIPNGAFKIDPIPGSDGMYDIWFYVQPMIRDVTWKGNGHVRTATIQIKPMGNGDPVSVTVTQYEPIRVDITYDDVKDPNDEDMRQVKSMIETYYNYTFAEGVEPFTIYVDRVDRKPMPWGFSGVEIDSNQNSGFENVYHLIDPPTDDVTCRTHQEFARVHYLPTGKGWRETENSGDVDYTRGSCMMHAAFMNHYQQYYEPEQLKGLATGSLVMTDRLPPRPTPEEHDGAKDSLCFGWCVPSIVGWQLLEKVDRHEKLHGNRVGIFDTEYPLTPFASYWTSNTGATNLDSELYPNDSADGKNFSFVYQFGVGLDAITPEHPYGARYLIDRKIPLRYRLISIDPHLLKSGNGEPDPMN